MLHAKNKVGLVFFPAYDWAISPSHPEREERLLYTQDQILEEGLFDIEGVIELKPDPVVLSPTSSASISAFRTPGASPPNPISSAPAGPKPSAWRCWSDRSTRASLWCGRRDIMPCASPTVRAASATSTSRPS